MSKKVAKPLSRILAGVNPYSGEYHRITLRGDGSITIERPYCCLIRRVQMPEINEKDYTSHYHLIGLIERGSVTDTLRIEAPNIGLLKTETATQNEHESIWRAGTDTDRPEQKGETRPA